MRARHLPVWIPVAMRSLGGNSVADTAPAFWTVRCSPGSGRYRSMSRLNCEPRATAFRATLFSGHVFPPDFVASQKPRLCFVCINQKVRFRKQVRPPEQTRFDFVEGRTLPFLSRDPLQVGRLTGRRHAATRTQPGRLRAGL